MEQLKETIAIYDVETLRSELAFCYPEQSFEHLSDEEVRQQFNLHADKNSVEITAGEVVSLGKAGIFISTPDGYQPIGDFYKKQPRKIYKLVLENDFTCESSQDHLYETLSGWKKAEDLTVKDSVLTKDGFYAVRTCTSNRSEEVYDWEVLHENHRYWAGDGISSHNTGKTFLTLNICREAQKMGYQIIYCDSEAAVDEEIMRNFGLDPDLVRYQPVSTSLEVRHFVTNLTDILRKQKEKGIELPKIMLVLDSLGNLATTKERTDAASGSEKKDMTKQQDLRSLFRVITTDLAEFKIPFVFTNHTYACALGDTPVLMRDGSYKNLEQIKINDVVMTLEGEQIVTDTFKYDNTRTIKLTFENGTVIECSPLHRFLISEDYTLESSWITAEELEVGDEICINDEVQVLT